MVYKKKRRRTWDVCRAGLSSYIDQLRALDGPRLTFPADLIIGTEKAKAFKKIEDRVDAVLCAYVAALAWIGKAECVGNLAEGYIVLPSSTSVRAM